ncbi:MAG: Crp/Fnr family transcriptional regulator [Myxococcota bacterium]
MSLGRELLRRIPIFSRLPNADLDFLAVSTREVTYARNAEIVTAGSKGDSLFVILEGSVKVVLPGPRRSEVILQVLGPGDFFGEMSLLDSQPRSATVRALERCRLLVLTRAVFQAALRASSSVAIPVLAEMSRRLRGADQIIGNFELLRSYGRVADHLIELARKRGKHTADGVVVTPRPTLALIAQRTGVPRAHASQALKDFQARGMLLAERARLVIRPSLASVR